MGYNWRKGKRTEAELNEKKQQYSSSRYRSKLISLQKKMIHMPKTQNLFSEFSLYAFALQILIKLVYAFYD